MAVQSEPLRIFCSFAPEDKALYHRLHSHLRPLEQKGILTVWHQRLTTAGTDWTKVIDEQLAHASIVLLLISPAFFASDYCLSIEVPQAMRQQEIGAALVIPILLRPAEWTLAPFAHLSCLPSNRKPITEWANRDAAFTDIVAGLRRVIEERTSGSVWDAYRQTPDSVWNVPYRRNPYFTGRNELLKKLGQQLSPGTGDEQTAPYRTALTQPLAMKGLGGIGKTQVAVEYAYQAREQERYTHTLWINAASEEALMTSFVTLAALLPAFSGQQETDQRKLAAAIKRWLEECQQCWLLIFDNADNISLLQEYLPQAGKGSILLTTRASAVGSLAQSIDVENMSLIEGTYLLLRRAQCPIPPSHDEVSAAEHIVRALDYFPLALDQAGAYIDETHCSLHDYLNLYHSHRKELLARRGQQSTHYPDSVATTWSLSLQKVKQANSAAAELLCLCSFLSPDNIPEELLRNGSSHWTLPLQPVADPFAFNQMIEELLKFSLIKRLAQDHLLSVHRLVQAVQMDGTEKEEQHRWAERIIRALNEAFPRYPREELTTWPQCLRYLEQVQACHALVQQHLLLLPEAADLFDRAATYLREHASYPIAELLYRHALSMREQLFGFEHLNTAMTLNNLANLYYEQGKYAEAEPLHQRALSIREQQLGPEHSAVAASLNNLANIHRDQGKYTEAEPLYRRALHIWEQQLGPEHPDVATILANLANLYQVSGGYSEAEPLYQRALHIWEQRLGSEHPSMARALNGLALLYTEQGKYTEAEPLYRRALHIWEQRLGSEHPGVARALDGLALLYTEQGKYAEAELLYRRALHIWEQQLGSEHPNVGYLFTNLADLYSEQGRYAEAEPLYQRTLQILERQLGQEYAYLARPLNGLARLYSEQGKYAEAESLYQRARRILEDQLGSEHHYVAHALNGLSILYEKQGKYRDAAQLYQRALQVREHMLCPDHPDLAETLHNFAAFQEKQGNTQVACSLYQRALAIRKNVYGLQHPKTIATQKRLCAVSNTLDENENTTLPGGTQLETSKAEDGQEG